MIRWKIVLTCWWFFIPWPWFFPSIFICSLELCCTNCLYSSNLSKLRTLMISVSLTSKTNSNAFIILLYFSFEIHIKTKVACIVSCPMSSRRIYSQKSSVSFKISGIIFPFWIKNCSWIISTSPKSQRKIRTKWSVLLIIFIVKHIDCCFCIFNKSVISTLRKR